MANGTLKVQNIETSSGSGTITLGQSGETISVGTTLEMASGKKQKNLLNPAFFARLSTNQSVSDNTYTKAECDTEILDTDGCYDNTTNYRFTPTVAGKYYVYGYVTGDGSNSTLIATQTLIYKNGSVYMQNYAIPANNYGATDGPFVACIIDMNGTTDYIELYGRTDLSSGTPLFFGQDLYTRFGAYRIRD